MHQEITCKACGHHFTGKYCNNCGEKVYTEHDRKVSHFFEEGFHFITHFEGKFFTTVKSLLTRPGKLSEDYCGGIRKSYFKPLSLFLLLVVVYLLFPVFEGLNMRLYYHTHHSIYGNFAMQKARDVMLHTGLTDAQLTTTFHAKSEKASKFLLAVILPLTALFFWAMTFKKRKYFFDQMVFATEVNSVYLIWGFMILPLLLALTEWASHLVTGRYFQTGDGPISLVIYLVMAVYVALAAKRFYRVKRWQGILLGILFYLIHYIVIQVVYKFLLFAIVINQIH